MAAKLNRAAVYLEISQNEVSVSVSNICDTKHRIINVNTRIIQSVLKPQSCVLVGQVGVESTVQESTGVNQGRIDIQSFTVAKL